ncbi:MAG: Y-family DNA polymerase [Paludibacteraceae bacterium]|nr:Y-family DNA polymerase [Paludibacteraceae bacterium]
MYGLADCNNFFVSCERVFRPDLNGKPVVVLSNNDGCVIARSNESKALGVKMGDPFFKLERFFDENGVTVFSGNYVLYGDISRRVMGLLSKYTPQLDIYSIDEAFLDFSGMGSSDKVVAHARAMVREVRQSVGIPISVGIAPTRTLAKVASRFAKKYEGYHGVCIIDTDEKRKKALQLLPVGDVFGIGRRFQKTLELYNVKTAYDFVSLSEDWVKGTFKVPGWRTYRELKGDDCIELGDLPAKQSICNSRSFAGSGETDRTKLEEAIADFTAQAVRKLRQQHSACGQLTVFAYTSRFRPDLPSDMIHCNVAFANPTADLAELTAAALRGLRSCYRDGLFAYKKAGVLLWNIVPESHVVADVFSTEGSEKRKSLMQAIDNINRKNGRNTVHMAVAPQQKGYVIKSEHRSPQYTTDIRQIIRLKVR